MAVAYKAVLLYNETLKENILVATAGIGEEKNESLQRKLQNSTDESKERERSKERSTSSEKYSTKNNETEDRKYHSKRNNKRQERYDDSRRNSFNRNNQHKGYDSRNNSEKMNNDFEYESERNENWRSRNNSYCNNSEKLHDRENRRRRYEDRNTRPDSTGSWRSSKESGEAYITTCLKGPRNSIYATTLFGNMEVPMLIDTGSSITIINEEIWNIIKRRGEKLKEINYTVMSVNKQQVKILGETEIYFRMKLNRGKSTKEFSTTALVTRGVMHKAIMGLDFMQQYKAQLDIVTLKMSLYSTGIKTVHNLYRQRNLSNNINTLTTEKHIALAKSTTNKTKVEVKGSEVSSNGKQQSSLNNIVADLGYESWHFPNVNHKFRQACDRSNIVYKKLKCEYPRKYSQSNIFNPRKGFRQSKYTYQMDNIVTKTRMLDTLGNSRVTRKPEVRHTIKLKEIHKEVTNDEQESMCNEKVRGSCMKEKDEVKLYENAVYKPEEVVIPSHQRNLSKKRMQIARYSVQDYNINAITIDKKHPTNYKRTLRRNITMLHIITILVLCIFKRTNEQVISDSYRNIGELFHLTHLVERQSHQANNTKIFKISQNYWSHYKEGQKRYEYYDTAMWKANDSQVCQIKEVPFVTQLMNNAQNKRQLNLKSFMAKFNAYKLWRVCDVYSLKNLSHIKRKEMCVITVIIINSRLREVLRQYEKTGQPTKTTSGIYDHSSKLVYVASSICDHSLVDCQRTLKH